MQWSVDDSHYVQPLVDCQPEGDFLVAHDVPFDPPVGETLHQAAILATP